MKKTVLLISENASTPAVGMGGRHYNFAKEMSKRGITVYLVAPASTHLSRKRITFTGKFKIEEMEGFTFIWVNLPLYKSSRSIGRVIGWFVFALRILELSKVISAIPDTILYSSPSLIGFIGAERLARTYGSRLVFEVRDIWPLTVMELGGYSSRHPLIWLMQLIEKRAYRVSDAVVSNLKYSVEHMVLHGLNASKFTWVPNGVCSNELYQADYDCSEIKKKFPSGKFIVGYVGTFGLANALDNLIDAAEILRNNKRIHFVLIGDGHYKNELRQLVSRLKLDNVTILDAIERIYVPTVLNYFNVVTVGAKKSNLYRFGVSPNKLFEYFLAGKPVIYYIESGHFHPVRDANAGIELESDNAQLLAKAIVTTYEMHPDERTALGRNGREAAISKYDYKVLTEKYLTALFPSLTSAP